MKQVFCLLIAAILLLTGCDKETPATVPTPTEAQETAAPASRAQELFDQGVAFRAAQNWQSAIATFTEVIAVDPGFVQAYPARGSAYLASGETEENLAAALADYQAALDLDASLTEAWLGLAEVHIRRGDVVALQETLKAGFQATGDAVLQEKLTEVESGNVSDTAGNLRIRYGYVGTDDYQWYHTLNYNAQGKPLSVTAFDAQGNQIDYAEYAYREDGVVVVDISYIYDNGNLIRNHITYNEKGYGTVATAYLADGSMADRWRYYYDDAGLTTRTERYGPDDKLSHWVEFTYDDRGNQISHVTYSSNGNMVSRMEADFDDQNRQLENRYYTSKGVLTSREIYEYDENGTLIRNVTYDADGKEIYRTELS